MHLKSLAVHLPSRNRFEQWNLADDLSPEEKEGLDLCFLLDDKEYLQKKYALEMRMNDINIARMKS